MPTNLETLEITDFLQAYEDSVIAKNKYDDVRRGSGFDLLNGISAILWSREAKADDDKFASIYFESAEGDKLTALVSKRFGIERILDSVGTGIATVTRTSTSGGAGTFWTGTRILVTRGDSSRLYEVLSDTPASASDKFVKIPIRSVDLGVGSKVTTTPEFEVTFIEPNWDNSWVISSLSCEDGSEFESSADFRARVRSINRDNRVGFLPNLVKTCKLAGAQSVFFFESNFAGDSNDFGLNRVYVGDANFQTTQQLKNDVKLALENSRSAGDNIQVLGMGKALVNFVLNVNLIDTVDKFDLTRLRNLISGAIFTYFSGLEGGFSYDLSAIGGFIIDGVEDVQKVVVTTPSSSISFLSGNPPNLPSTLIKYSPNPNSIVINFFGPI